MDYKVVFSAPALADLEGIVAFVAQHDRSAATRLGDYLVDEAESLAVMPERGSNVKRRPRIKKLVRRPYLIIYRVDESQKRVEIVRIWHGAQNPEGLFIE